ncbi:MFS transporter [Candidatus Dojkabacteria bacterium]|nr:MFS transporter [Candidatus Dojkabacteria bacterium]
MAFKKTHNIYLVSGLYNVTNAMLFTTYFLYLTNDLHLSFAMAALLDMPVFITQLFMELPSGFFADKFGLKRSVIIGTIALAIAPVLYFTSTNYTLLFINGIFYGIGFAFISGAFDALAYDTFAHELKRFYTIRQLVQNLVNIIIPVITIWLSQMLGLRIFYFFDFLFKLIILAVVIFGINDVKTVYEVPKYGLEFIRNGFASIQKQLRDSKAVFYQANSQFLWGITSFAVDVFWIKLIEVSAGQNNVGYVFALASIVAVLGNLIAYKLKIIKTAFWVTFLVHSMFVIFAGVFIGTGFAILCIIGRSIFVNIHEVLSQIIVNKIIKTDRASMLSFFSFLTGIGKIIASLFIGIVADSFGIGSVWILAGLILLVISWQLYQVQKYAD